MKKGLVALTGFLAVAACLLWEEHQEHILGALPWALLLLCPLLHFFLHGGHGTHGAHDKQGVAGSPAGDHGNTGQGGRE